MVDQAAMDAFFKFENHRANPIPAILADTFLTMDVCHQKRGGMIRCCTHMLFVWIMAHMDMQDRLGSLHDPLRNFGRILVKQQKAHEWKNEFTNLDESSFKWVCPWYRGEDVLFSCGDFPNVPLMGPRGCVSYAPALVLRQLRWTQHVPNDEQLRGFSFMYKGDGSTTKREKEVRDAWKNIHLVGAKELGKHVVISTSEYQKWRMERMKQNGVPQERSKGEGNVQSMTDMATQIERLKAQMQFLEQKKEAAEWEVVIHQTRCQKLADKIEKLKDAQADASSSCTKRARKGKEVETRRFSLEIQELQAKVKAQEERMANLLQEKENLETHISLQDQRITALQIELNQEERRSGQRLAIATDYQELLQKANGREEYLRRKIEELEHQTEEWRREAQRQQEIKEEWVEGWQRVAQGQAAEKEEWMRKYGDMSDHLQYHAAQFVDSFEKADIHARANPCLQLPPEIEDFMNHCRNLAKGFRKKKTKSIL